MNNLIQDPNVTINEINPPFAKNECENTGSKKCRTCQVNKPFDDFYKDARGKYGCYGSCKKCTIITQSKYQGKHKERRKLYMRTYQQSNESKKKLRKYYLVNRDHIIHRTKQHARSHPEQQKNAKLKRNFGITLQEMEQMFVSQEGKCAICENPFNVRKHIHVDHNHTTKRFDNYYVITAIVESEILRKTH